MILVKMETIYISEDYTFVALMTLYSSKMVYLGLSQNN